MAARKVRREHDMPPPARGVRALRPGRAALAALSVFAIAGLGCARGPADVSLSKVAEDEAPPDVPVPPEDGPRLLVLTDRKPVFDRPSSAGAKLGELRVGATLARSVEPYSRKGCPGGWYAVRPRGFACADDPTALSPETAAVLPAPPSLDRALPYRYGRVTGEAVPVYARFPTLPEQAAAEPDLAKHFAKLDDRADRDLGAGANDVPLDARGVAKGPPVLLPGGDGVDAASRRPAATYFVFAEALPPPIVLPKDAPAAAATLRKQSGVAVTNSVLVPNDVGARRFGVTPEGRLVPIDRLRPLLGTTFHGMDVSTVGLPIAFVHRSGARVFHLHRGDATPGEEELERRAAVALTGRFRTVDGVRYEEARDGYWLRARDLTVVVRRSKLPEHAKGTQRWLDVSLANQTLTAYEGAKPIYATLVSTGRDQLGDPAGGAAATKRGTFRVREKLVSMPIDPREVHESFDVAEAPWALVFEDGHSITGAYWADVAGEAQGFHNVAMSPIDARRIWTWATPELPEGYASVVARETDASTLVHIRP
jgi:hypothetical protein